MSDPFKNIIGKTIQWAGDNGEIVDIHCTDGSKFRLIHHQKCCEDVTIEDKDGEISDSIGKRVLKVEELTNMKGEERDFDSYTWTFYAIHTTLETITYRFFGESNGFYSESVCFEQYHNKHNDRRKLGALCKLPFSCRTTEQKEDN